MWIILTIFAAFFNALWTALSKQRLEKISPYYFTLVFRSLTVLFLLPVFLYDFKITSNPVFWFAVFGAGALEMIGIYVQAIGVKKDFYSTYSLANLTPLFTLIIAPYLLPEKISLLLVFGVVFTVSGGMIFYQLNRSLSIYGIIRAACIALASVLAKIAIAYSSGLTYPFITFVIGILLMVIVSPFRQEQINWGVFKPFFKKLLPLAFFSAIATLLYYVAIEFAPVTKVNPLLRINLIFGFALSYFLLHERENLKRKILAGLLILIGTIMVMLA